MARGDDTDEQRRARRKILRKYARIRMGRPVFCGPSRAETQQGVDYGIVRNGKVIFDNRQAAEDCATALTALTGEMFRPYECPRSKRGHHHLTEDRSPANRRVREERYGRRGDR